MGRSFVQGSVLGPTLWLIYIQSLLDRLVHKCIYYAYADDVTIVAKISTKTEIKRFQKTLKTLLDWGVCNTSRIILCGVCCILFLEVAMLSMDNGEMIKELALHFTHLNIKLYQLELNQI